MFLSTPGTFVSKTRLSEYFETPVCFTGFQGAVREETVFTFREYLEQGGRRSPYLLVDLSGVSYLSSTGLGVLVDQARSQERANGWLRVVDPSPSVQMILNVSGLAGAVSPVASVEAGVRDLAPRAA